MLGEESIAVLYQAHSAPTIDGTRKPKKPGGYRDSGADIGYALTQAGVPVVTPEATPDPGDAAAWVFPDSAEGIQCAIDGGAQILWANTVLFRGHPIEAAARRGFAIVGQEPERVHVYDDKSVTNALLAKHGCRVPVSTIVCRQREATGTTIDDVSERWLATCGLSFPLVLKPVRGRGSEGVIRVDSIESLQCAARALFETTVEIDGKSVPKYGHRLLLEEYLPGTEITLTVMPPGEYSIGGVATLFTDHWSLPPILRFNHDDGIAPYSGVVAVTQNSRALSTTESSDPAVDRLRPQIAKAADIVGARAPIRIDCRKAEDGEFYLFDLNMKPNMTGAGRPGRDEQDSLSLLAAREIGWRYEDLLINMLRQAWTEDGNETARQRDGC